MDKSKPTAVVPHLKPNQPQQECQLDELGYCFVKTCIEIIESRGLDDQGLYRIVGVNSRVARLIQICLDRKNIDPITRKVNMPDISDPIEWETKTITSALKNYLRNLPEPLMTYRLHSSFVEAAKHQDHHKRISRIQKLVHQLPEKNFAILKILIAHLRNVSRHSIKNLMTVSNLSICFGPTLLRAQQESVSAIMEIKFFNVVVSILIEGYDKIFPPHDNHHQSSYSAPLQPIVLDHAVIPNQHHLTGSSYNICYRPDQHMFNPQIAPYQYYYPVQPTKVPIQYPSTRVITLYACIADAESELSFGPNEIITDGK